MNGFVRVLVPPIIEGVPWAQDCGVTVVSETLEPRVAVPLLLVTVSALHLKVAELIA